MAFLDDHRAGCRVGDIRQRFTVAFHRHFFRCRLVWRGVVPRHVEHRLRRRATLFGIHLTQASEDTGENFTIGDGDPRGVRAFPVPLQPAAGVDDRPILFGEAGGGQTEHFGLDFRRIDIVRLTMVLPEGGRFGIERVDSHEELQLRQGSDDLVFVRERGDRVKALANIAIHFALIHHLEVLQNVVALIPLRQPVIAPAVFRGGFVAEEGFHHGDEELRIVAPVVDLVFQQRLRRVSRQVGLQVGLFFVRQRHVAWQAGGEQAEVGQALDIGVAAQGVDAAARHPHVAEQQLDHRHGADILRTDGVLGPAESVQERCGLIRRAGFSNVFTDFEEVGLRRTADVFDHIRGITGNMLLQQVPDAARMLQRSIAFGEAVFVQLIVPAGFVVLAFFCVIAAEQPVVEAVVLTHDQAGVGVGFGVFAVEFFVIQQIQDHARQEGNVGTGTNRGIEISHRRRTRKARIDNDELGAVMNFGFHRPAEPHRMRFCGVTAHHYDQVGVFNINPVVGHRTATKCWSKTCYRWSVSDTRLVIHRQHPEGAGEFLR